MFRRRKTFPRLAPLRLGVRLAMAWTVIGLGASLVCASDYMYVSMGNNTIVRYDVSLATSALVQASGSVFVSLSKGLNGPSGLAFDKAGNLYAANQNAATITRYDTSGNRIGTDFVGRGQGVSNPFGLAFDKAGNLYAANQGGKKISKYNSAGVLQFEWSTSSNPRMLAFPTVVPEP